jgi:PTS system fructose-specific IIA component
MPNIEVSHISQLLTPATIRVGLAGHSKREVIDGLLETLRGHEAVRDLDRVRTGVFEREDVMSTGVGKGLALPHAKTSAVDRTVAAFASTAEPIDFGAIDNKPVRLVFLLIGTETAKSRHIKILSRISRLMNRDAFRESILQAESADEILDLFRRGEMELIDV